MQDPTAFQPMKPHFPEQEQLKCPRCDSPNTKFCYYNNYNLSQPRHFCKNCRRYWTKGGALRNIPVGGGSRKNTKRSSSSSSSNSKRPTPSASPSPSPSVSSATLTSSSAAEPYPVDQDRRMMSFSSLLASTGHLGSLLEGLNSSGSSLKMVQMDGFAANSGSGQPVNNSDSSQNPGLEMQGKGNAESFLSMQNGDSSCWNNGNNSGLILQYTHQGQAFSRRSNLIDEI